MSAYTDAASRPGKRLSTGTDDRELFMTEFATEVQQAYLPLADYSNLTYTKTIQAGKAETFPIIGRLLANAAAAEHTPGEIILGGGVEHNDVTVTLDKVIVSSVFIPEIDELMEHVELRGPYARLIASEIAQVYNQRIARTHILASRVTSAPYTGGPVPSYFYHANAKTDPAQLELAAYGAVEYIKTRDISGAPLQFRLPWAQYLLAARYAGFEGGPVSTGTADRGAATIAMLAGIPLVPTNSIPSTNITTGNTKFQGDFSKTVGHIGNEMAVATLNRRGLRMVMKEQEDRLGTLLIGSQFCGHGKLRPECSFEVATGARA